MKKVIIYSRKIAVTYAGIAKTAVDLQIEADLITWKRRDLGLTDSVIH